MRQPDNCCVRCIFNNSIKFCLFVTIEKKKLAVESKFGLLGIHTQKVQNNTKKCIHNCSESEYVIQAFGYSYDFGMIIGSGVEISFPHG